MATGFYQVPPGNKGVVQRFGTLRADRAATAGAGASRGPSRRSPRSTSRASSPRHTSRACSPPNRTWSSSQVAVQYRIKHAEDYLFKVRDPEQPRSSEVSESAIREVVGPQRPAGHPRSGPHQDRRGHARRSCSARSTSTAPASKCVSVNITDVQVPEAVQQAQRDSVKAKADRERVIKEAQAYANGILPQAAGRRGAPGAGSRSLQVADRAAWPPATPRASASCWPPTKRRRR